MRSAFVSSLVSCFLYFTSGVAAQSYWWSAADPTLVSEVAVVGNGIYTPTQSVVLTTAANNLVSAVWANQLIQVSKGFNITISFKMTQNPSSGATSCQYNNMDADGIVFVLNPNDVTQIGTIAQNIGYNFQNNLAVEFDTYVNSGLSDPSDYHVGIQSCGTDYNSADHGGNCAIVTPQLLPSCFDNIVHFASIIYDPASKNVTVYHDGIQVVQAFFNMSSLNLINGDYSYFGVTSSTGGFNSQQELFTMEYHAYSAPTTAAPTTAAPTTAAPTTAAPSTAAPSTTATPTTAAPTTARPTTAAPTTARPTTAAPTTAAPTTAAPAPCPNPIVIQTPVLQSSIFNILKGAVTTSIYSIDLISVTDVWSVTLTITPPLGYSIANTWGLNKNNDGTYSVIDNRFSSACRVPLGSKFAYIGYSLNGPSILPAVVTAKSTCQGQCSGKVSLIVYNQWGCGTNHFVHYKIAFANAGIHLTKSVQVKVNLPSTSSIFTTFNLAASSTATSSSNWGWGQNWGQSNSAPSNSFSAATFDLIPGNTFSETGFVCSMPTDPHGRYILPTVSLVTATCS